jgi:hypothetical protein
MAGLRFTRQVRLAEVGEEGQAKLESAVVTVCGDGTPQRVEARYLRGAGLVVVVDARAAVAERSDAVPAWLADLSPAARDVAAGAHAALDVVRSVLAGTPHPCVKARSP